MRNNQIVRYVLPVVVLCGVILAPFNVFAYTVDQLPTQQVFGDFVVGPGKVDVELKPGGR
jgi:hypothetical protein